MERDEAICMSIYESPGRVLETFTLTISLNSNNSKGQVVQFLPFYRRCLITLSVAELRSVPSFDDRQKPSFMRTCKSAHVNEFFCRTLSN